MLYQDWFLQRYNNYWKNKLQQQQIQDLQKQVQNLQNQVHTIQDSKSAFKSVFESAFKSASESVYEPVYKFISESVSVPAEWKEQLQLLTSKQSLLITAESVFLIQSCSHHASYRSFYFWASNQHLYHHNNQYWLSYYNINKFFQMYNNNQNTIYDFE